MKLETDISPCHESAKKKKKLITKRNRTLN